MPRPDLERLDVRRRVQKADGVIHHVTDLTADIEWVSGLDGSFRLQTGQEDKAKGGGSGLDSPEPLVLIVGPRDMYESDVHIDTLESEGAEFHVSDLFLDRNPCDSLIRSTPYWPEMKS